MYLLVTFKIGLQGLVVGGKRFGVYLVVVTVVGRL